MPLGAIVVSLSVICGGIIGGFIGNRLSQDFKKNLERILGLCSMCMGISAIGQMQKMPAVVLSIVLGTSIGLVIHLGDRIQNGAGAMQRLAGKYVPVKTGLPREEADAMMVTVLVLFCASGTGIYGSMVSGFSGDHSILFSKAVLDLFTAAVFACSLGAVVCLVAIPQFLVMFLLFLGAGLLLPLTTPALIADFKACGGFLMVATGFRMMKVIDFPIADMIPAMVIVMPLASLF